MKSILRVAMCISSLLVALAAPTQLAAQEQNSVPVHYAVTDLGTLGGTASLGFGVNNAGVVDGVATVPDGDQHAFLWYRDRMTYLGTLGGPNSIAYWLNNRNEATIASDTSTADPLGEDFCFFGTHLICLGALWNDGTMIALPTLGGNNDVAFTLNDRGQIVGAAENTTQDPSCPAPQVLDFEAVIWGPGPGQVQALAPLAGDTVGFALSINNKGEAVGSSGSCANTPLLLPSGPHAVLWQYGFPINLGSLGGSTFSTAASVNDREEVISASILTDNTTVHSFLWSRDTGMRDIGTLEGDVSSLGGWINNLGRVVGWSCDSSGNCRAYLWQNNVMTDLNSLIPTNSKLYLEYAYGITDAGDIVGQALDKSTGDLHAFLARPVRLEGNGADTAWKDVAAAPSPATSPDAIREKLQQKLNDRVAAPA